MLFQYQFRAFSAEQVAFEPNTEQIEAAKPINIGQTLIYRKMTKKYGKIKPSNFPKRLLDKDMAFVNQAENELK